VIAAYQAIIA